MPPYKARAITAFNLMKNIYTSTNQRQIHFQLSLLGDFCILIHLRPTTKSPLALSPRGKLSNGGL